MAVKKTRKSVVVRVDRKLKALYDEAMAKLHAAQSEGAHAWDDRYEALGAIIEHEPPLYLAAGFSTDLDFITSVGEDKTSLYRNVRVAKYASPVEIERYGASRLDLAIALVEAQNGGPLKARTPIAFEKLRFTVKVAGKLATKSFGDLKVEDLRAALALAKGREARSKQASPVSLALTQAFKKAKVKDVTFTASAKRLVVRLPLDQVARVGAVLASLRLPT